jgi:hypothetical protein
VNSRHEASGAATLCEKPIGIGRRISLTARIRLGPFRPCEKRVFLARVLFSSALHPESRGAIISGPRVNANVGPSTS